MSLFFKGRVLRLNLKISRNPNFFLKITSVWGFLTIPVISIHLISETKLSVILYVEVMAWKYHDYLHSVIDIIYDHFIYLLWFITICINYLLNHTIFLPAPNDSYTFFCSAKVVSSTELLITATSLVFLYLRILFSLKEK